MLIEVHENIQLFKNLLTNLRDVAKRSLQNIKSVLLFWRKSYDKNGDVVKSGLGELGSQGRHRDFKSTGANFQKM